MITTLGIIEQLKKQVEEKSNADLYVDKIGCKDLANTKCSVLEVTDPSFFDDSHNILQITIGKLYNSYRRKQEKCKVDYGKKNKLLDAFSRVNASLLTLQKDDIDSMNDLHRLAVLATGITLRDQIAELVKEYLKFMETDILIVPIDDIDLNIAHAYRMCEQIRKYLCVPRCVVFLSLKIEQLQYVVENAFAATIKIPSVGKVSNGFNSDEIAEMAKKYVNKLVPVNSRVEMPKAYSLADVKLELPTGNGGIMTMESMKKGVLELIYNRTRYLFYNPADSISPIVPNNLRDLFNLIALLAAMEEIPDSREPTKKHALETNKNMFKFYLFSVWKKRFDINTQNKLDSLVTFDYGTSFNKEIILILSKRFEEQLKKDYHEQTEDDYQIKDTEANISDSKSESSKADTPQSIMLDSICATDNFGYNVTAGDLFYLFSILEREALSENDNALLFFLKSLYSIKLYEAYDQVTELEGMVYPETNDEEKGLTIVDRRFDHSNKLQLLTGGSYFTYCPGDLIPKPSKEVAYDMRIISGKELNGFLSMLRDCFREIEDLDKKVNKTDEEEKKIKEFDIKLNIVEFFILTTKCAVPQKKAIEAKDATSLVKTLDFLRHNVEACHYRTFYPATGYYLFDIMSIFGNMINLELTYKKFYYVNEGFYRFIFNHPGSLLYKIMEKSSDS